MQMCVWIFCWEGDVQLNGLMIKVIACFLFFFSLLLPSSTAERDGIWVREGWLGTEIKKYKAISSA